MEEIRRFISMNFMLKAPALILIFFALTSTVTDAANDCSSIYQIFSNFEKSRKQTKKINFNDDLDYLTEDMRMQSAGRLDSQFVDKWNTRVYYTATGKVGSDGKIPMVDPDSRGVVVFFHGSGTTKASGKNFADKMNSLSSAGYSTIGIDMPFHGEGPMNEAFYSADYFMNWLHKIVQEFKTAGKPIYFAGHSFGPDVIAEYAYRYPHDLDGAMLASPAGFNKTLATWYNKYTSKMKFGGDTVPNDAGGEWAGKMSEQFLWSKNANPANDPSVLNPKLKLRVLTGDREEYVPAPVGGPQKTPIGKNTYNLCRAIKKLLRNATCTTEEDIGHYIFQHQDKNGDDAILREILALDGKKVSELKQMAHDYNLTRLTTQEKVQQAYARDPFFQHWVDTGMGRKEFEQITKQTYEKPALKLLEQYEAFLVQRRQKVLTNILATESTAPEFYAKYKTQIEVFKAEAEKKKTVRLDAPIIQNYLSFLATLNPELRAKIMQN